MLVCAGPGETSDGSEKGAVEQCQFCWMLFSLSDLISHVPSCPARSGEDRGVRQ